MATILHEADLTLDRTDYNLKTTQVPLPAPNESFKVRVRGRRRAEQPLADRTPWGAVGAILGGALWGALGAEGRERGLSRHGAGPSPPAPAQPMRAA